MEMNKKMHARLQSINILTLLLLIWYPFFESKAHSEELPLLTLRGEKGGLADGGEWLSSTLKDKVNLLLYVDPDKQSRVKALVTKLDSIQYSPDLLGLTFILNTEATIIPDFILANRVKKRAKEMKHINYVLDRDKVLVREWNLVDNDVNILLLDNKGIIVEKISGKISTEMAEEIIQKINQLINKGETL